MGNAPDKYYERKVLSVNSIKGNYSQNNGNKSRNKSGF